MVSFLYGSSGHLATDSDAESMEWQTFGILRLITCTEIELILESLKWGPALIARYSIYDLCRSLPSLVLSWAGADKQLPWHEIITIITLIK